MLDATPRAADTDRAMSQDNVDVVRRFYGFWQDGDNSAIFGVCEFCEGKVLRFTGGLRDRSEAFEVAGLRG